MDPGTQFRYPGALGSHLVVKEHHLWTKGLNLGMQEPNFNTTGLGTTPGDQGTPSKDPGTLPRKPGTQKKSIMGPN